MTTPVKIFGTAGERTRAQTERCATDAAFAVLCADNHVGYSQPIGGAVTFEDAISPSGMGYDIGCGNKAVRTPLRVEAPGGYKGLRLAAYGDPIEVRYTLTPVGVAMAGADISDPYKD